jgi:hypothetical protein
MVMLVGLIESSLSQDCAEHEVVFWFVCYSEVEIEGAENQDVSSHLVWMVTDDHSSSLVLAFF